MVTEDTNGTSANVAVELSGSEPEVLLGLARRTAGIAQEHTRGEDVSIEQEGPQRNCKFSPIAGSVPATTSRLTT